MSILWNEGVLPLLCACIVTAAKWVHFESEMVLWGCSSSKILFTKRGKFGDPRIILEEKSLIFKNEK